VSLSFSPRPGLDDVKAVRGAKARASAVRLQQTAVRQH